MEKTFSHLFGVITDLGPKGAGSTLATRIDIPVADHLMLIDEIASVLHIDFPPVL
ncbi:MAG TPA: hypothetical protein VFL17_10610 [Anaerolineae bacterium]|nr:hypothetical protein [Anaerolineae bacterium]